MSIYVTVCKKFLAHNEQTVKAIRLPQILDNCTYSCFGFLSKVYLRVFSIVVMLIFFSVYLSVLVSLSFSSTPIHILLLTLYLIMISDVLFDSFLSKFSTGYLSLSLSEFSLHVLISLHQYNDSFSTLVEKFHF